MPVLHAGWYRGQLFLWAENGERLRSSLPPVHHDSKHAPETSDASSRSTASTLGQEVSLLIQRYTPPSASPEPPRALDLWVPAGDGSTDRPSHCQIFGIAVRPTVWDMLFASIQPPDSDDLGFIVSPELRVITAVYEFARSLVLRTSFLPSLNYYLGYYLSIWKPWLSTQDQIYLDQLSARLPMVARALEQPMASASELLSQWLTEVVDGLVRRQADTSGSAVVGPMGRWLQGLAEDTPDPLEPRALANLMVRGFSQWEQEAKSRSEIPYRMCFRVEESENPAPNQSPNESSWYVRLLVQSLASGEPPESPMDSAIAPPDWIVLLDWAAHFCPPLAAALAEERVDGLVLSTDQLLDFIEHQAPRLKDAGASVLLPAWWAGRRRRIKLAVKVTPAAAGSIRLGDVNQVDWTIALGDDVVSVAELARLAESKARLVRFRGQWVELADDVTRWAHRLQDLPDTIDTGTAVRWGIEGQAQFGPDEFLPASVEADGWMAEVITRLRHHETLESIVPSPEFHGTLRPYQLRGLAWLDFLHRFGLGACLADDMGLGKTVQALALIDRDYQRQTSGPVLLVCPTSVVSNWQREAERFTPTLPVHIHQGSMRLHGEDFRKSTESHGLIVTSYPLLRTDADDLLNIQWFGIILDEAQNIKNASTRQSQIACRLLSTYRIALTGTPLENRLEELWALMRFLNPGLFGSQESFRRQYAALNRADASSQELSSLQRAIEPFLLRRTKTDPAIIDDLPDKIEIKEYCQVTREQASLYQAVLDAMDREIRTLNGMNRRGLILATLTRLKQILNHPAHYLADHSDLAGRSGKIARLDELLEEILSENHRALIFTQFAEMGRLLQQYLHQRWGERPLFLHGGVKPSDREAMVGEFQTPGQGPHLFILSLRAGGTGLNLTQASHVIHYDRWWNPAVENQATDRAFRIGQHQNVTVHKFVSQGTVEERIDRMIEQKTSLAERVVGSGESWITELSSDDLHRLLALSTTAEGDDDA